MKLWTWHKPDFSLLDGHVDHERSEYMQSVKGIVEAYRQLAERIGTSQFIWCYTAPNQHIVLPCHTEVEWVLDVPRESILRFVDDIVWNRILGIRCGLPPKIRHRWFDEALRRFPNDAAVRDRFCAELEDAFGAQSPPGDCWWDSLFTQDHEKERTSALVPHPVAPEWVLVNPICTG